MLLQAMQCQFCLVIDKNFKGLSRLLKEYSCHQRTTYISHEFLARYPDVLRQRSTEHHYLLVMGCCAEDFLNVAAHVW